MTVDAAVLDLEGEGGERFSTNGVRLHEKRRENFEM
jgi:hypothetical protein